MYPTKNTLDQKIRIQAVALLQERLSSGIDLILQAKQAHWNIKGENFYALHLLFDKVHEKAEGWVDGIAERIAQMGGEVEGTVQATAEATKLPEYPRGLARGVLHADALSESLAYFGELVRTGSTDLLNFGDAESSDLLLQISRSVGKYLWMVEAHTFRSQDAEAQSAA